MKTTLALISMIGGCAATPIAQEPQGPRGLRADQHLTVAHDQDQYAEQLSRWPDTRPAPIEATNIDQQAAAGHWYAPFHTASEQRRKATLHRAEAAEEQTDYEQACGDRPLSAVAVSPLARYGIGGDNIPGGVIVLMSPDAGTSDQVLAAVRCHRAWLMLGPARANGADESPLDLADVHITTSGGPDSVELSLTVDDPQLVTELRRRTQRDLEHHRSSAQR